jgi:hypothetical protein
MGWLPERSVAWHHRTVPAPAFRTSHGQRQLDLGRRVQQVPENHGEKGVQIVDDVALAHVEPLTVFLSRIAHRDVELAAIEVDFKREDRAARGFPLFLGVEFTETVFREEIARRAVVGGVNLPIHLLTLDETPAAEFRGRVVEARMGGEFEQL